jgi:hypothetical protein
VYFPVFSKRILILVLLVCVSFSAGVFANSGIEKVEAFLRGDYQVFLDGKKVDVGKVLVYQGSSYLPLAKIGGLLGADVVWNAENKGIYVNSRFLGQPDPIVDGNVEYESITMTQPAGYLVKYLGKDHPVLAVRSKEYKLYYRDNDIKRMGINTDGLSKAQEQSTMELYLTEAEITKAAAQKPVFNPTYEKLVIGVIEADQMKSIQNFIDGLPALYKATASNDPYSYFLAAYIYSIEALPNNEFNIIGMEGSDVRQYWLKLKKNQLDQWYYSEHKIKTLVSNSMYY